MKENALYRYLLQLKIVLSEKGIIIATPNFNMLCTLADVHNYDVNLLVQALSELLESKLIKFKVILEKGPANQFQPFILFENDFNGSTALKEKNLFILFKETERSIDLSYFNHWLIEDKSNNINKLFLEINNQFN